MTDAAQVSLWILTIICFSLSWTAYIQPHWRSRGPQSGHALHEFGHAEDELEIVGATEEYYGLWLKCKATSSGEWQCDKIGTGGNYQYYNYIIGIRWVVGLGLFFQVLCILVMPFQMPCAFADEPEKGRIEDSVKGWVDFALVGLGFGYSFELKFCSPTSRSI